jgi:hypothetical protein
MLADRQDRCSFDGVEPRMTIAEVRRSVVLRDKLRSLRDRGRARRIVGDDPIDKPDPAQRRSAAAHPRES